MELPTLYNMCIVYSNIQEPNVKHFILVNLVSAQYKSLLLSPWKCRIVDA